MADNDTENRILDASFDVVCEHSISGTRVHLVAERAGIVPSNLHYYFKTKEDMLVKLLERMLQQFVENREAMLQQEVSDLPAALDCFFQQMKAQIEDGNRLDFVELDFWVYSRVDKRIKKQLDRSFVSWRKSIGKIITQYCPGVDKERKQTVAQMMVSLMLGACIQYEIDQNFDLDNYFKYALATVMQTLDG